MDGNGRWAKARGMERPEGHKEGVKVFENIANLCFDYGLDAVTFYAFSTENWKRPKKEVDAIMKILDDYLDDYIAGLVDDKVHFRFIGDLSVFPEALREKMERIDCNQDKPPGVTVKAVNCPENEILTHHSANGVCKRRKRIAS